MMNVCNTSTACPGHEAVGVKPTLTTEVSELFDKATRIAGKACRAREKLAVRGIRLSGRGPLTQRQANLLTAWKPQYWTFIAFCRKPRAFLII